MSTNLILLAIPTLLTLILLVFVVRLEIRMRKLFRGKNIGSMESLIADMAKEIDRLGEEGEKQNGALSYLDNKLTIQGHRVSMMRFNPFPDAGGNQSFALAIINGKGDGLVVSSLYSRERMSVFAKPVTAGKSDIELSAEEQQVVTQAFNDTKNA